MQPSRPLCPSAVYFRLAAPKRVLGKFGFGYFSAGIWAREAGVVILMVGKEYGSREFSSLRREDVDIEGFFF